MTSTVWTSRLAIARLSLGRSIRHAKGHVTGPALRLAAALGRKPTRLIIAPQDLRTADPTVANDTYAGHFAFAGRIVSTGGHSPFEVEAPSKGWAAGLYGFGWLRHLRAAGTPLARSQARALVDDFIGFDRIPRVAWDVPVLSRRIISWVTQSPLLLDGADLVFYKRFVTALARHVAVLRRRLVREPRGLAHLQGAIAMLYAAIAFDRGSGLLARATSLLERELDWQILPDGSHVGRNPRVLVDLLLDMLPLRQSFGARDLAPPAALAGAIARMLPMLRLLRHADGTIALFNGAGAIPRDWLATLSVYDDSRASAFESAPYGGYQRLSLGDSVLIMDAGGPPPPLHSGRAHAGCLAIEFSSGGRRWFVNCGAPDDEMSPAATAARATAAHSTATVADLSACRFATRAVGELLPILAGPRTLDVSRDAADGTVSLAASHDGYLDRVGVTHRRRVALESGGGVLSGEDSFPGELIGDRDDVALRFHLFPGIRTSLVSDGRAVLLVTPDGQAWRFDASGLPVAIEESVFFAGGDGTRRTEQIAVHVQLGETREIAWRLIRLRAADARQRPEPREAPPQLDIGTPEGSGSV